MRYEHIFFDLDRTLWDFEKNSSEALSELLKKYYDLTGGIDEKKFIAYYQHINELLWDDYRKGFVTKEGLRFQRFYKTFLEFGIDNAELSEKMNNEYVNVSVLKTHLYSHTHEALTYLSSKYNLHIITNGFEETQYHKINNCKLSNYFKNVITSEQAGEKKPHRKIFEYALKTAGAKRQRSLMIGDHIEVDIIGARRVGIDQIFVNHHNIPHNEKITYEVGALSELIKLL